MCGIAGTYLWPDGGPLTARLTTALAHRGPDGTGRYGHPVGAGEVHLGHRRLSIIDLSPTGAQPMVRDGLALTYNGELYNHPELRAELESTGVRFRGTSDTEVLLEAWRRWGVRCLPRLRGMFAFAVFDERTGELVLARDQLGIKPLFVLRRDGGLVFASELKALAAALGPALRIDESALVASLLYYWVPDSRCVYRDVEKLPQGTFMRIRPDGSTERGRYYSIRAVAEEAAADTAAGRTHDLATIVADSTRRHLVADVPVAMFLSGGLDSSYLTALAAREREVSAYTIRFRVEDTRHEAMPDDLRHARRVARRFGVPLTEIEIAPQVHDLLPHLVAHLDEPIGDPAAINTYLICAAARAAGIKVMLSGMGADELFGGYRKHLANVLAARYYRTAPRVVRDGARRLVDRLPVASATRGYRWARFAKRFLSFAELPEETAFRRSYTLYDRRELRDLVAPDLAGIVDDVLDEHAAVYHDQALDDVVNRMCLADARLFLPGLNLTYTDRAAMAASVEVRVPFVDVEVVRAAFALPGHRKVAGHRGKVALKQAARAVLPRTVVHRPKGLFSAPLRAWMSRDLAALVDEVVHDGLLVESGFLRREALRRLVAEDASGRQDRAKHLWHVLTLEQWYRGAVAAGAGDVRATGVRVA